MDWFEKQIQQRSASDQQLFEDAFFRAAGIVLGKRTATKISDDRIVTKRAIDDILKYYHFKPVEFPGSIKKHKDQLDYCLRPYGIMKRRVELTGNWWQDSFGPLLGYTKNSNKPVALLPNKLSGYYYIDRANGKKVSINCKSTKLFDLEAYCFYKPFPQRKLGIPDLIIYMKDCITINDAVFIGLSALTVTGVGMIMPRATKALTGPVISSGSARVLVAIAICIVCTAISAQLMSTIKNMINQRVQSKTTIAVQSALMMRVMSLPANFFRSFSAGELVSRSQSVSQLCDLLFGMVVETGLSSLMSLLYVTQILSFSPALVIPSLVIIIITVTFSIVSSIVQIRISKRQMELGAQETGLSYSMISGVQKIKLSGAEKRFFARWLNIYSDSSELIYMPPMFIKINGVITTGISLVSNIVLYYLAVKSGIGQSNYYAFTAAYASVMGAFSSLAGIALSVGRIKPILEMAKPFMKTIPETAENKEIITKLSGNIELNNVYFRYNNSTQYIINNLSLKIKAGEYVAIVGKTGCGKSTLMRLLLGFEKPEKGAIYYNGKDLNNLDLASLRRNIGSVIQNGGLLQGDIFSNIVISAPYLTLKEAWEAAEIAGIAEDIRSMPMGMQTLISEGHGGISGGQKQRLMIARAIAPKPKILMFDEATSALDNKTQKQVSEALDKMGCTRIVIAHRLSTIRHCDHIVVFDNGRIIEEGTYEQLINKCGCFAALVERQRLDK